ncbi:MAG: response regulator transcription factor [Synergistaceae bacterium]
MAGITSREREVLYWLAHGQNNKEIASTMILSEKTIKNHITHLLRKLDVTNRTKAAAIAWSEGLPLIPGGIFLSLWRKVIFLPIFRYVLLLTIF